MQFELNLSWNGLQETKLARSDVAMHLRPASFTQATSMFKLQDNRAVPIANQQAAPHSEKAFAVSPPDIPAEEEAINPAADQEPVDVNSVMEATEQLQALLAQVDSSPDFAEQLKRSMGKSSC